jgi:hypothetical protein
VIVVLEFIIFYALPAVIAYFGTKNHYKEMKYSSPDFLDVLYVILPFVNIGVAIGYILDVVGDYLLSKDKIKKVCRKFFGF